MEKTNAWREKKMRGVKFLRIEFWPQNNTFLEPWKISRNFTKFHEISRVFHTVFTTFFTPVFTTVFTTFFTTTSTQNPTTALSAFLSTVLYLSARRFRAGFGAVLDGQETVSGAFGEPNLALGQHPNKRDRVILFFIERTKKRYPFFGGGGFGRSWAIFETVLGRFSAVLG